MRHCHLYPLYFGRTFGSTFCEMEPDATAMFIPGTSVICTRSTGAPVPGQIVGNICFHLSLCVDRDTLRTPKYLMLCNFVFCCNFCAPQCASMVVVRFLGGAGGASLGNCPPGWQGTVPGVGKGTEGGRVHW